MLLDAECAWFGDPAFDVAFCLTHLLLKTLVHPDRVAELLSASRALAGAYTAHVDWEEAAGLDHRVASLLPALLLARVDGASPVEYLTSPADREDVRTFTAPLLRQSVSSTAEVIARWAARRQG